MSTKAHHSRFFLGYRWPAVPHDYLLRRRMFRKIVEVTMVVLLSLLVAGAIIYASIPSGFDPTGR
jgi:predicted PurR-regulated permease PerM